MAESAKKTTTLTYGRYQEAQKQPKMTSVFRGGSSGKDLDQITHAYREARKHSNPQSHKTTQRILVTEPDDETSHANTVAKPVPTGYQHGSFLATSQPKSSILDSGSRYHQRQ